MTNTQINTLNQFNSLVARERLATHGQTGIVKSMKGMNPGFDTGFAGCNNSLRALSWMANRGLVKVGPALRKQLAGRNRDGYLI